MRSFVLKWSVISDDDWFILPDDYWLNVPDYFPTESNISDTKKKQNFTPLKKGNSL